MNDERRPLSAAHPLLPAVSGKGNTDSGERERLLTAAEIAAYVNLSPATILDWWEQRRIPGYRLGGRKGGPVRFRASEIEEWLAECRVDVRAS